MQFEQRLASIQKLLAAEEDPAGTLDLADIPQRQARRTMIGEHLAHLASEIRREEMRLDQLPALPDLTCMQWAQNILAYPNGRLLLVDTRFPGDAASIVQVLVLDFTRRVRLHTPISGDLARSSSESERLGISPAEEPAAVSLPSLWPTLRETFYGCYVLAYDLSRLALVLDAEARRHHLGPVLLIGDDLLPWLLRFFHTSGSSGLVSLCERVGHPLPPHPTIGQRALGQLALLEAMALGMTGPCQAGPMVPPNDVFAHQQAAPEPSANGKDETP